jgi:transposase
MRGKRNEQPAMFYAIDVEARIRPDHPLRDLKAQVDRILASMHDCFEAAYSSTGRPSIPPERLLKALLLMGLYSVRSERQLAERIDTDLLFRWFLDMSPEDPAFDASSFSQNRPRLDKHELTRRFFEAVRREALTANLCSEHFSIDGTIIESFASIKSIRPIEQQQQEKEDDKPNDQNASGSDSNSFKPRNLAMDFRGQKRSNATHRSVVDPEARLYRKSNSEGAKLCHLGHVATENRHGLVLGVELTQATGTAEREAAVKLLEEVRQKRIPIATAGMDKGFDSGDLLIKIEAMGVEPHVAMMKPVSTDPQKLLGRKKSELPGIQARQRMQDRVQTEAYRLSQKCRKKAEEAFGWIKTIFGMSRSRVRQSWKLRQLLELAAAAYNLVRMRKLLRTEPQPS